MQKQGEPTKAVLFDLYFMHCHVFDAEIPEWYCTQLSAQVDILSAGSGYI